MRASAVLAELRCPECADVRGPTRPASTIAPTGDPAGPSGPTGDHDGPVPGGRRPVIVVRLPVGVDPTVSLSGDGATVAVRSGVGPRVWEHEVDLPFVAQPTDVTFVVGGGCIELRVTVPVLGGSPGQGPALAVAN
jgi:hypothetical protein